MPGWFCVHGVSAYGLRAQGQGVSRARFGGYGTLSPRLYGLPFHIFHILYTRLASLNVDIPAAMLCDFGLKVLEVSRSFPKHDAWHKVSCFKQALVSKHV